MNFSNLINFAKLKNASSIGIIGGADGPTAIFIAGNPTMMWVGIGVVVLAVVACVVIIVKKRKK